MWSLLRRLVPQTVKRRLRLILADCFEPRMVDRGNRIRVSNTCHFYKRENVTIGPNVFIWHFTILDGSGRLTIEEGAQIGASVGLFTHSSHISIRLLGRSYMDVAEDRKPGYVIAPVRVGRYAFISSGAKILPGVTVGDHAVVVANSVVLKDVPPHAIVSGVPARVVGSTLELDRRELEKLAGDENAIGLVDPAYREVLAARETGEGQDGGTVRPANGETTCRQTPTAMR